MLCRTIKKEEQNRNSRKPCECYRIKLSDEIRLPPGKATSRVAFAFMLLEDGFGDGIFMKLTHDQRRGISTAVQITRQGFASFLTHGVGFDAEGE